MNGLKIAIRQLQRSPGFTMAAVLTLGLGMGAMTAIFSVVYAVLLRPLPYPEPDRLVWLAEGGGSISVPNFSDWKEQQTVFENLFLYRAADFNVVTKGEPPLRVLGAELSADAFPTLRLDPAIGRFYSKEEDKPGGPPVVVLDHSIWRSRLGGDPNIINTRLSLNGVMYTVIGVAPEALDLVVNAEFYVPVQPAMNESVRYNRKTRAGYQAIGRLKQQVSFEQAKVETEALSHRLAEQYPDANRNHPIGIQSLIDTKVGAVRHALWILLSAVAVVLIIACANAANLVLVRATGRRKEMAVRLALGANRRLILTQMLAESLLLSLLGATVGLLFARGSLEWIVSFATNHLPRATDIRLDGAVALFSIGLALVAGILAGWAPAWFASRPNLSEVLNEAHRGSSISRSPLLRGSVIGQVALTLVLLICAALLLRSFQRLHQVNPGFNSDRVLSFRVDLPSEKYSTPQEVDRFSQTMLERFRAMPGIETVSLATQIPMDNRSWSAEFLVEGRDALPPSELSVMELNLVSADYFRTLGIPVLKGRAFNRTDVRKDWNDSTEEHPDWTALKTIIIDEEFARRHFSDEDPVGQKIRLPWGEPSHNPVLSVVGVVGRVKHENLKEENTNVLPLGYLPYRERPNRHIAVVMKTAVPPETLVDHSRQQIAKIDSDLPLYDVRTLEQRRKDHLATESLNLTLLGVAAVMALVLAFIGIYGVVSYSVAQRHREIGIRFALGADRRDVATLVLRQGMRWVCVGVGLGLVGAFGVSRVLGNLLYQVAATDGPTFTLVPIFLVGVAALACAWPALRASQFDPMELLKEE